MNVLIVIYDFPPYITGGSVIRTMKYLKYLSGRGFNFTILSVRRSHLLASTKIKPNSTNYRAFFCSDPIRDFFDKVKAQGALPAQEGRTSLKSKILNLGKYFVKWGLNNCLFPDQGYFWIKNASKLGTNLLQERSIDLIYSSFPEPAAHWLAYKLAKKHKLPLVLDYRDLWSSNPLFQKNFFLNVVLRRMEKRGLAYAARTIFTTQMARDHYLGLKMVPLKKTELIWNGFDEDDFDQTDSSFSSLEEGKINFTYTGGTGQLNGQRRNPKYLLDAFGSLSEEIEDIRFHFFGTLPSDVQNYISKMPSVSLNPMVPHSLVPSILKASDVLVAILTKVEDISAVPGKVFEYMAARKFIVALTEEESQLAALIQQYRFGLVVRPDSTEKIKFALQRAYDIVISKEACPQQDAFLETFNRRHSAKKLEGILNEVGKRK